MKKILALGLFGAYCFCCDVFAAQERVTPVAEQKAALDTALEQAKAGKFQYSPVLPNNQAYACQIINQSAKGGLYDYLMENFLCTYSFWKESRSLNRDFNQRMEFGRDKYFTILKGNISCRQCVADLGLGNGINGRVYAFTLFLLSDSLPKGRSKTLFGDNEDVKALAIILKEQPYLLRYFDNVKIMLENIDLSLLPQLEPIIDHIKEIKFADEGGHV